MNNTFKGEVDFPEAGEGVYLRCLPGDLAAMEKKLAGVIESERDTDHKVARSVSFSDLVRALEINEAAAILSSVEAFAKRDGKTVKVNTDAIDLPMRDIGRKCLDALFLGVHGKTWDDYITEMVKQAAELNAKAHANVPSEGSEI